ncbi:MAG: FAD-dependent oxidoreductase [Desulfobacterales bacterium]|nr:FAD-dependent oxidoreductase [Desulfobacterales bacterium]
MTHFDVIIIGAGASGLMCAGTAGRRGRRVLVLERNSRPGEKILYPEADGAILPICMWNPAALFRKIRISVNPL